MKQITLHSKEELMALLTQKHGRVSVTQKLCPGPCGQKLYRVFIKGQEKWWGCKCGKLRPTRRGR